MDIYPVGTHPRAGARQIGHTGSGAPSRRRVHVPHMGSGCAPAAHANARMSGRGLRSMHTGHAAAPGAAAASSGSAYSISMAAGCCNSEFSPGPEKFKLASAVCGGGF